MKRIFITTALALWGFVAPVHGFPKEAAGQGSNMAEMFNVSGNPDDPGNPTVLSAGNVLIGLIACDAKRQPGMQSLYPAPHKYSSEGSPRCINTGSGVTWDISDYMAYAVFYIIRFEGPDIIYPHYYTW